TYFAQKIILQYVVGGKHVSHLPVIRKTFGGGEKYLRLDLKERNELNGKNVVYVGSATNDSEIDEMERLGSAVAKYGARRVIYIIPFEAYTTMERATKAGEVVTAKVIARRLSNIPQGDMRNSFFFMDLHKADFVHYFEGNCLPVELYAE